jgi:hypothetical protein
MGDVRRDRSVVEPFGHRMYPETVNSENPRVAFTWERGPEARVLRCVRGTSTSP